LKNDGWSSVAQNVFLSFATEDQRLVNAFRAQARNGRSDLEFCDYSVKESFERAWKTGVERLIRRCSATICLVGESTWSSDAVDWEIRKSDELGKKLIAVRLDPDVRRHPRALRELGIDVVPWDIEAILLELGGVTA
jgi:hypothetical protein